MRQFDWVNTLRWMVVISVLNLLLACSSRAPVQFETAGWQVQGKLVLIQDKKRSLRFSARAQKDYYQADFSAPLGAGHWRLQVKDAEVIWQTDRDSVWTGQQAKREIARQTGLNLPPEAFFTWLLGQVESLEPGVVTEPRLNETGQLMRFQAGEWLVKYHWPDAQARRPSRISLSQDGQSIQIYLRNWTIAEA